MSKDKRACPFQCRECRIRESRDDYDYCKTCVECGRRWAEENFSDQKPNAACSLSKYKTQTEEEWRAEHGPHGEPEKEDCCEQPLMKQGVKMFRLICPCGKRLIGFENLEH